MSVHCTFTIPNRKWKTKKMDSANLKEKKNSLSKSSHVSFELKLTGKKWFLREKMSAFEMNRHCDATWVYLYTIYLMLIKWYLHKKILHWGECARQVREHVNISLFLLWPMPYRWFRYRAVVVVVCRFWSSSFQNGMTMLNLT